MRWFKHYSDMYRGRSIVHLLDTMGHTGLCFFLIQEMCAEKMESKPKIIDENTTTFTFHTRFFRSNLRVSASKLQRLLSECSALGLLSFKISGNSLEIKMPILLDLLSRDSKKARHTRASDALGPRLDIDIDIDIDKITKKKRKCVGLNFDEEKKEEPIDDKKNERSLKIEQLFNYYPKRDNTRKAIGIRSLHRQLTSEILIEHFERAVQNYAEFCRQEKIAPQFVKQFATFCGTNALAPWREWIEWTPVRSHTLAYNGIVER